MVAAVANANAAFFMSEPFQFPELKPGGRAMVAREHPFAKGCREI
jgi:hypothetical protein